MASLSQLNRAYHPDDEVDFNGLDILPRRLNGSEFEQAKNLLPQLLMQKALPRKIMHCLRRGKPAAIILIVSENDMSSVTLALLGMCSDALRIVHCQAKKDDAEQLEGIKGVGAGAPVLYLTANIKHVPELCRKLCSGIYTLGEIDPESLRETLRRCTRGRVPNGYAPPLRGIALPIVTAAIVSGSTAANAMSTLDRLAAPPVDGAATKFPKLEDCVEYGPLRDWGLALGRDLQEWRAGKLAGSDLDSSILLVSPPGYGKTFFAGVLQQHLGIPLFRLAIGEIMSGDGYLNTALRNMTNAFEAARANAPAILFLDEVDTLGRRSEGSKNDHYFNSVVNHGPVLLDGIGSRNDGVVVIGATNRRSAIDPALVRPGRLSRTITLELPNASSRQNILRTQLGDQLSDAAIEIVARRLDGSSPSQIMQVVKEAKALARSQAAPLSADHFASLLETAEDMPPALKRRIAIHEAGHATCGLILNDAGMRLVEVSIQQSSGMGGRTSFAPAESEAYTSESIEHRAMMLLAGRAAELVVLGDEKTTGAGGAVSSDLALATQLIASSIASFGLYDRLAWRCEPDQVLKLLNVDAEFQQAVENKLRELMMATQALLQKHRRAVERLSDYLLLHESADAATVFRIVQSGSTTKKNGKNTFKGGGQ